MTACRTLSILSLASLLSVSLLGDASSQQGPSGPQDPDQIFRQLDVNGDGKLTLDEGGPGSQQFVRRLLEMAKKAPTDSISREELRRLAEQHRRGAPANPAPPSRPDQPRPDVASPDAPRGAESPGARPTRTSPRTSAGAGTRRSSGASSGAGSDLSRDELQTRLAGTWRGWVVDGRGENPNTGHLEMELRVEGNRMVGREIGTMRAPQGLGDGTFTIDGNGDSGTLDAISTSGQHKGRSYPGIFALADGTLRWCVNNRNGDRPTEFETGRGNYFLILRKQ